MARPSRVIVERTVREVLVNANDLESALVEARSLVQGGHVAVVRCLPVNTEIVSLFGLFGPILEPVALPSDKKFGPTTAVSESGLVLSSTSWHHGQSFASAPPARSALHCDSLSSRSLPTVLSDGAGLISFLSGGYLSVLRVLEATHEAYYAPDVAGNANNVRATHPVVQIVEGNVEALFISPATVEKFEG